MIFKRYIIFSEFKKKNKRKYVTFFFPRQIMGKKCNFHKIKKALAQNTLAFYLQLHELVFRDVEE